MDKEQRIAKALYTLGYQGSAIVRSGDIEEVKESLDELEVTYSIKHWTRGFWKLETSCSDSFAIF